jgi:hypothetical protein
MCRIVKRNESSKSCIIGSQRGKLAVKLEEALCLQPTKKIVQ